MPEIFSLPIPGKSDSHMDWRLDARGLEWTDLAGKDRWMPFACVRRATLGHVKRRGWQLRLSGPPGAVMFGSGAELEAQSVDVFTRLAGKMIEGAAATGGRARFCLNHRNISPDWLWARSGRNLQSGEALMSYLPKPI